MRGLCIRRRDRKMYAIIIAPFIIIASLLWLSNGRQTVSEYDIDDTLTETLDIDRWVKNKTTFCGGNYTGYDRKFFRLKSAIYEPEDDVFSIDCYDEGGLPSSLYTFDYVGRFGLFNYSNNLKHKDLSVSEKALKVNTESPTVVIYREHAHNFYHAMTQWYGVYLMSKVFGYKFSSTNILIIDRVAYNQIDDHWKKLFNSFTRVKDLKSPQLYNDLILSFAGPESPMNFFKQKDLPFIQDFSNLFLHMFGIHERKKLDCSKLVVVLSLRHDYIFHPEVNSLSKRNAERKFENEQELIQTLEEEFKGHTVKTILAENVPLVDQLRLATNTDVMISMHGCTLTHTLFLPKHAAIFELYPKYWEFQDFYRTMARWSKIRYDRWRNEDKNNEFADHYTRVPPEVFRDYARRIKQYFGCTR